MTVDHEVGTHVGSPRFALVADTVTSVLIGGPDPNNGPDYAAGEIYTDGAAEVWWTVDGTDPEVDGADSYYIPAAAGRVRYDPPPGPSELRFVSSGTPTLRVQRVWS